MPASIKRYRLAELPPELWTAWDEIQRKEPCLASPYFTVPFAQAVSAVSGATEVGVLMNGGAAVGFFPFERSAMGIGRPLAKHLSDFQAVIATNDTTWDPAEMIRGCGLSAWDFDHVLACQKSFEPFAQRRQASPFIDLPAGFGSYEENRKAAGSKVIKHLIALARKLEREVGPIRFEYHSSAPEVFQQALLWKKEQYQRTGAANVFAQGWTVDLLTRIMRTQSESFGGVLSVLWAGSNLVALHLGMRSRSVWHYWFPTYDPIHSRYSPGLLLLLEMFKAAEAHGLKRIDLGKGDADYKERVMTGASTVLEGSVTVSPALSWLRQGWSTAASCVRRSPLGWALRYPVKVVRAWKQRRSFS